MAKRRTDEPVDAVAAYVGRQLDAIAKHAPRALDDGRPKSVHKARVASRRLRAALDLLEPLAEPKALKPIATLAKRVRQAFGDVRDADVMAAGVASLRTTKSARDALGESLGKERKRRLRAARKAIDAKGVRRASKWTRRVAAVLDELEPAIEWMLREAVRNGVDAFVRFAEAKSGDVDRHKLRIEGKRARYALEIAAEAGVAIAAADLRAFEAFQKYLGDWHDAAVLGAFVAERAVADRLAERWTEDAAAMLKLAAAIEARGTRAFAKFTRSFRRDGKTVRASIGAAVLEGVTP